MFSPSLISAMVHSIRPLPDADGMVVYGDVRQLAQVLQSAFFNPRITVPVVAGSRRPDRLTGFFEKEAKLHRGEIGGDDGGDAIWGRVPLLRLVSYFQEYYDLAAKEEYVDLGTPMSVDAASSVSFVSQCDSLLRKHPLGSPRIAVAIVDGGCRAPKAVAENFGGRLHQIQAQNLVMSSHAVAVLWALIERLNQHDILDETDLYCALVAPPASKSYIGPTCFTHGNSPEMLRALQMLGSTVSASSLPTIINMSMGTHVGPHNGDSPLENYVRTLPSPSARRYFFVPAGNDGQSGVSASRPWSADRATSCASGRNGREPTKY